MAEASSGTQENVVRKLFLRMGVLPILMVLALFVFSMSMYELFIAELLGHFWGNLRE